MGIITLIKSKLLGKLFAEWVTTEEDVEALDSINSFVKSRIEELTKADENIGRVKGFSQWSVGRKVVETVEEITDETAE